MWGAKTCFSFLASQLHWAIGNSIFSWRIDVGSSVGEGMTALDLSPLVWFVAAKLLCTTKNLLSCFNWEIWIGLAGSWAEGWLVSRFYSFSACFPWVVFMAIASEAYSKISSAGPTYGCLEFRETYWYWGFDCLELGTSRDSSSCLNP